MSRHTLWHFTEWRHLGQTMTRAVLKAVGDTHDTIAAAAWAITAGRLLRRAAGWRQPLAATQEDTLRFL
ncbi:MAG: hypothetical protein OXN21_10640 [Chloroflexota bacterium]|nr:hypothetical protein [Chloroflexota bacterium]